MKKIITSCIIVLSCLFSAAYAFSWNGVFDNNTKVYTSNFKSSSFTQSNDVYLSLNVPFSKNRYLVTEGLLKYDLTLSSGGTEFTPIVDLDLLKFTDSYAFGNGIISYSIGRFNFNEASGTYFTQCSDGAYVTYDSLKIKGGLYVGYTGLLNSLNVGMAEENPNSKNKSFYNLCVGYIPINAEFFYKTLFDTNRIGLQISYFYNTQKNNTNGMTDKFYGTLSLGGPITTIGAYNFKGIFESAGFKTVSIDSKLDLSFYIGKIGVAGGGIEYIPGKLSDSFVPFTSITARSVTNGAVNSGIFPKLNCTVVYNNMYATFTEKLVLAMPEKQMSFRGFDTTINFVCNIFSDLQVGCDITAYIDIKEASSSNYTAAVKASLSF